MDHDGTTASAVMIDIDREREHWRQRYHGLPRARAAAGENPDGDAAWLVDPYGFTVLRYAPGFDPGDLRTDLARLLKIN